MPVAFDRDSMAAYYANRHKTIDPAIAEIHYLPTGAPANEIRFVEVNGSIADAAAPEPLDFGVDGGTDNEHKLVVLDVTPKQWKAIREGNLLLPPGWRLEGSQVIHGGRPRKRR